MGWLALSCVGLCFPALSKDMAADTAAQQYVHLACVLRYGMAISHGGHVTAA